MTSLIYRQSKPKFNTQNTHEKEAGIVCSSITAALGRTQELSRAHRPVSIDELVSPGPGRDPQNKLGELLENKTRD